MSNIAERDEAKGEWRALAAEVVNRNTIAVESRVGNHMQFRPNPLAN